MPSPIVEVIVLGIIQGVTEFLPISSDGHLALAELLFHMKDAGLTLTVMLHAGTLLATLLVLRRQVVGLLRGVLAGLGRPSSFLQTPDGRDALFVIVASLPTAVIGLLSRDLVASLTASPLAVALGFLVTGALLVSSLWAGPAKVDHPGAWTAFLVGTAQGIAVLPGVSRSGSTIVLALWLGVQPIRAFELSMLISLPAVGGAVLLEARHIQDLEDDIGLVLFGAVVAFFVGILALNLLRKTLIRGLFPWFALWVVPLGVATMALAWAWPAQVGSLP